MNAKPQLNTLAPSMKEAERMLDMLDAGGEFTFQTFADADKNKNLVHIYHGSLEAHFDTLARLNGQGAGVFVTVNQTDLQGRTSDNVTRARALWVDFDTVDHARLDRLISMDGIPPNLIIESSAGKHHAYWIIAENDEIPLNQFTELQKRLIHHFADDGADKAIHDLPRVMRLTGFYHRKGEAFMTQVVHSDEWRDAADLIAWIESLPMPEVAKPKAQAEKPQARQTQQTHYNLDFKQAKLLARGRWEEILSRIGYPFTATAPNEHVACPMCGGIDRFRFDNENGDGSFICSQGTGEAIAGDGFELLEHGGKSAAEALQAVTHALSVMGLISEYDNSKSINEWKEPKPIKSELLPVQQLSQDMLPLEFKEYVFDEAIGANNMSPDMVAACLITSFASLIGAKVGVKPKTYSNWTIVPNLWGGIVAPPSSKKSPAFNAGTYPLDRLVASAREEFKEAQKKHEVLSFAKDADKSALKSKLKDASKKGDEEKQKQIIEEMMQLEEEAQPILRRYKTNDSSPEALAELEKQNPNGVLVLRDELTGWLESVDKDPSERAFYLEAFNGDKPYEFDRILRGHGYIENHCLSILGGIQPDKLITYLEPSIKGMGNDGLFQRFQVLVYPDATEWKYVDRIPNKLARNEVFELFKQVDEMDEYSLVKMGANPTDDYNTRPFFRFGQKAQELYVKWTTDLHKNKVENEEHSIIAQHLQKYPKLMTSLALIFHIIDGVKFGTVGDISEQSAEMAIQWCEYLESHARRIYGLVLDAATIKASSIGQKLLKLDAGHDWRIKGFKAREIHRKNWKGLTDIESVENALELLVDNNWIVLEEIEPTVKGGRPSKQYWINPKIYEMS